MITQRKCRTQPVWLKALLLISLSLYVHPVFADELPNPRIKRVYTDEDAPPEIRFGHFLRMLSVEAEGATDRATRWLEKLEFKRDDIPRIHEYFTALSEEAQAEVDKGMWRLACHSGAQSLAGLEIRVVYNSFDDLRFAVDAKYLAIASAELASKGYPDFLFMIDGYPGSGTSFRIMSTDHRFAWGDTDFGIQENRAAICQGLTQRLGTNLN